MRAKKVENNWSMVGDVENRRCHSINKEPPFIHVTFIIFLARNLHDFLC
jgi:hypothetical protein